MEYDAIIIGGGLSGLSCAASLAAKGKKVIVLEKHLTLGGFIQTFKHKDWEWNVGTHVIGEMKPDDMITNCFNYITDNKVAFLKLDEIGTEIKYPDRKIIVPADRKKFIDSLVMEFPLEKENIVRFVELMEYVNTKNGITIIPKLLPLPLAKISYPIFTFSIRKYRNQSLKQMLDLYFQSPLLKNIFSYHCTKIGASPDKISFIAYSIIFTSYIDGCFYPQGSGDSIVRSISDFIRQRNGKILTHSEVKHVVFDNKKIIGVTLKDNTTFKADIIISSIGIAETIKSFSLEKLLSREHKILNELERTYPLMILYIGFNGELNDMDIKTTGYHYISSTEDIPLQNPVNDNWAPETAIFYFALKNKQMGKNATAQILVPTDYTFFKKWENTNIGKRGEDYNKLKIQITEKLIFLLKTEFPGIEKHIVYTSLATPLTSADYTGSINGSIYRLTTSVNKFNNMNLSPLSSFKNLYFTGSDIFVHGMVGSFLSGILTACSICRKNLLSEFNKIQKKQLTR